MKAKKSLGQNFLKSTLALNKIIEAGEISSEDIILEIGPGKGALTEKLLENSNHVIAVEKDRELFEFLKTKFEKEIKNNSLILLQDDILEFELSSIIQKILTGSSFAGKKFSQVLGLGPDHEKTPRPLRFKIIANIPYNITGSILKKFLTAENQPTLMILMVQHEVAKRIVSKKESLLSISVKAYGEPKLVMKVAARYFSPAPKVDSAIIAIKNISRNLFIENTKTVQSSTLHKISVEEFEEKFWKIVKKGFAHKRKKLSGNLKGLISGEGLSSTGLEDKRAEDLTLKDWFKLVPLAGNAIISP